MELLRIQHLKKVYSTRLGSQQFTALSDVSFEVAQGEFVAIMGASGSGKTTLLNLIASLDKPTAGDVYLDGRNLKEISNWEISAFRRNNLGFVFQEFNLLDSFSVRDNILLPLVLSNMPVKQMEDRLVPVAKRLELGGLLNKFPHEISGGEKQRTAVARAIITDPKLVLADEPTGSLDSRSSGQLLEIFQDINAQGQTIVVVSHSSMVASHAGRVIFIKDGRLFSQVYRGESTRREFFDKIIATLAVLADGGVDIG
ncbi:MAG: ABC transporter ATP-binding protein [Christensenellales bacterium]|jgi:putative ABC transport system ATP-binding protein